MTSADRPAAPAILLLATFAGIAALVAAALLVAHLISNRVVANPPLPTRTYVVGTPGRSSSLELEVADTEERMRRGLMGRDAIGGDGMAFLWNGDTAGFWMHGTRFPLDIAFVGINGRVDRVVRGMPHDERPLESGGATSMVIEVAAGRASKVGLVPGAPISIQPLRDAP